MATTAMTTDMSPTRPPLFRRLLGLFRFRLVWLFVAITVIAVFLAAKFHREPIGKANLDRLQKLDEIERDVFRLVWSDDRSRVAFVGWEMPVDIRETVTLWPVQTHGEGRKIIEFAFSPDENIVAWTENGKPVEIHNLNAGKFIQLDTGTDQCDLDFSPDGKLLAVGGYDLGAMIVNAADGRLVHKLDTGVDLHGGMTLCFSPDGKVLAAGNRNYATRLFDVASGQLLHVLNKPQSHGLAFHPSGKTLAIGYATGEVRVWDVATGKLLHEAHDPFIDETYSVDWSPDGSLLATSGLNGDISLLDENLNLLRQLPAPEWVISVKFSPNGSRLISAGGGQTQGSNRSVTIWGVPPSLLP
jgi:WD40 repeat protein